MLAPADSGFRARIRTTMVECRLFLDRRFSTRYFLLPALAMNVFTTIAFGCTPTGISVSNEYSVGSSFRALRF
jgi:hypothetical protein